MCRYCVSIMAKKELHIRISERRLHKLRLLAVEKDKTVTQIVEDLIDMLPEPRKIQCD
ncbi:hypothetical protein Cylst_1707 [Cylindrospermum stagnale PCC 7417]|uniref:Uncharacterized protein n=1 Tax=Cylindrospermum stagnale PCC 7417 TaxID=56107 RepID=K9WVY5_9NOST|nr:hypothetical protein Cylst_1707 [Cylindrospermum stagnale PCC 7417]